MKKNISKKAISVLGYVGMGLGFVASIMSSYADRKQSDEYIDARIDFRLNERLDNTKENESYCEEV